MIHTFGLFLALPIFLTSAHAIAMPKTGLEVLVKPFDFYVHSEGVNLERVEAQVYCLSGITELVFSKEAQFYPSNSSNSREIYHVFSPEFKNVKAKDISSWYGICTLQYKFHSTERKKTGTFALGPLSPFDADHNHCSNHTLTTEDVFGFKVIQSPNILGHFSENCPAYFNFYENAQKKISQIVLRPLDVETERIAVVASSDYQDKYYKIALNAEREFEVYWRKMRSGLQTEPHNTVKNIDPSHVGLAAGGIIGGGIGGLYKKTLVDFVVGGALGSLLDNGGRIQIAKSTEPLKIPKFDQDLIEVRAKILAAEWRNETGAPRTSYGAGTDFSWVVTKLVSGTDINFYEEVLTIYTTLLAQRNALSSEMIRRLGGLKKAYSPRADKLFDLILSTNYQEQGSCVSAGTCDQRVIQ